MRIERPADDVLRLEASRESALILAGVLFLVILVWEWLVGGRPLSAEGFRNFGHTIKEEMAPSLFYVLALLPLPLFFWMIKLLFTAAFGHVIVIDADHDRILKNGNVVARREQVQAMHISLSEDSNYRAKLILRDGKEVKLGVLCGSGQIDEIIHDIHRFTDITGIRPPDSSESPAP